MVKENYQNSKNLTYLFHETSESEFAHSQCSYNQNNQNVTTEAQLVQVKSLVHGYIDFN